MAIGWPGDGHGGRGAATPEWGAKPNCQGCGRLFYGLGRNPATGEQRGARQGSRTAARPAGDEDGDDAAAERE